MRLYDCLIELKDKNVSIGTKLGNGYIYIGPASNIDEIDEVFKFHQPTLYTNINCKLNIAESYLKNAKYNYYKNNSLQSKYKSFDLYKKSLMKNVIKYNNMLDDCIDKKGIFKYWKDREVLDTYIRTTEDYISIIIEGCEYFRSAWSRDEYLNKNM